MDELLLSLGIDLTNFRQGLAEIKSSLNEVNTFAEQMALKSGQAAKEHDKLISSIQSHAQQVAQVAMQAAQAENSKLQTAKQTASEYAKQGGTLNDLLAAMKNLLDTETQRQKAVDGTLSKLEEQIAKTRELAQEERKAHAEHAERESAFEKAVEKRESLFSRAALGGLAGTLFGSVTGGVVAGEGINAILGKVERLIESFKELVKESSQLVDVQDVFERMAKGAGVDAVDALKSFQSATEGSADKLTLLRTGVAAFQKGIPVERVAQMEHAITSLVESGTTQFHSVTDAVNSFRHSLETSNAMALGSMLGLDRALTTMRGNMVQGLSYYQREQLNLQQTFEFILRRANQIGETPKTIEVAMERIKVSVQDLIRSFGVGVQRSAGFQEFLEQIGSIGRNLTDMQDRAEAFGKRVGNVMGPLFEAFKTGVPIVESLGRSLRNVFEAFGEMVAGFIGFDDAEKNIKAANDEAGKLAGKFQEAHPVVAALVIGIISLNAELKMVALTVENITKAFKDLADSPLPKALLASLVTARGLGFLATVAEAAGAPLTGGASLIPLGLGVAAGIGTYYAQGGGASQSSQRQRRTAAQLATHTGSASPDVRAFQQFAGLPESAPVPTEQPTQSYADILRERDKQIKNVLADQQKAREAAEGGKPITAGEPAPFDPTQFRRQLEEQKQLQLEHNKALLAIQQEFIESFKERDNQAYQLGEETLKQHFDNQETFTKLSYDAQTTEIESAVTIQRNILEELYKKNAIDVGIYTSQIGKIEEQAVISRVKAKEDFNRKMSSLEAQRYQESKAAAMKQLESDLEVVKLESDARSAAAQHDTQLAESQIKRDQEIKQKLFGEGKISPDEYFQAQIDDTIRLAQVQIQQDNEVAAEKIQQAEAQIVLAEQQKQSAKDGAEALKFQLDIQKAQAAIELARQNRIDAYNKSLEDTKGKIETIVEAEAQMRLTFTEKQFQPQQQFLESQAALGQQYPAVFATQAAGNLQQLQVSLMREQASLIEQANDPAIRYSDTWYQIIDRIEKAHQAQIKYNEELHKLTDLAPQLGSIFGALGKAIGGIFTSASARDIAQQLERGGQALTQMNELRRKLTGDLTPQNPEQAALDAARRRLEAQASQLLTAADSTSHKLGSQQDQLADSTATLSGVFVGAQRNFVDMMDTVNGVTSALRNLMEKQVSSMLPPKPDLSSRGDVSQAYLFAVRQATEASVLNTAKFNPPGFIPGPRNFIAGPIEPPVALSAPQVTPTSPINTQVLAKFDVLHEDLEALKQALTPGFDIEEHRRRMRQSIVPQFAEGGVVPATSGGQQLIAGEAGEAEWIIPESKLDKFLNRFKQKAGPSLTADQSHRPGPELRGPADLGNIWPVSVQQASLKAIAPIAGIGEFVNKALTALDPTQGIPYMISQLPGPQRFAQSHPQIAEALHSLVTLGLGNIQGAGAPHARPVDIYEKIPANPIANTFKFMEQIETKLGGKPAGVATHEYVVDVGGQQLSLGVMRDGEKLLVDLKAPGGNPYPKDPSQRVQLGISGLRAIWDRLQADFPGVTSVEGGRVTGAAPGRNASVDLSRWGMPQFAEGGIATRPTAGIFGEAGPEALLPLDRLQSIIEQAMATGVSKLIDGVTKLADVMDRLSSVIGGSSIIPQQQRIDQFRPLDKPYSPATGVAQAQQNETAHLLSLAGVIFPQALLSRPNQLLQATSAVQGGGSLFGTQSDAAVKQHADTIKKDAEAVQDHTKAVKGDTPKPATPQTPTTKAYQSGSILQLFFEGLKNLFTGHFKASGPGVLDPIFHRKTAGGAEPIGTLDKTAATSSSANQALDNFKTTTDQTRSSLVSLRQAVDDNTGVIHTDATAFSTHVTALNADIEAFSKHAQAAGQGGGGGLLGGGLGGLLGGGAPSGDSMDMSTADWLTGSETAPAPSVGGGGGADFSTTVIGSSGSSGSSALSSLSGGFAGMASAITGVVGALGGFIQSITQSKSAVGGILGGGLQGAQIGTMIMPGIGTAVGAIAGAIFGGIVGNKNAQITQALNNFSEHFKEIMYQFGQNTNNLNQTILQLQDLHTAVKAEEDAQKKGKGHSQFEAQLKQISDQIAQLQQQQLQVLTTMREQVAVITAPTGMQDFLNQLQQIVDQYDKFVGAAQNADDLTQANEFLAASLQQLQVTSVEQFSQANQQAINDALNLNQLYQQRIDLINQVNNQIEGVLTQGVATRAQTRAQTAGMQIEQIQVQASLQMDQLNEQIAAAQFRVQAESQIFNLATTRVGLETQLLQLQNGQTILDMQRIAMLQAVVAGLQTGNLSIIPGLADLLSKMPGATNPITGQPIQSGNYGDQTYFPQTPQGLAAAIASVSGFAPGAGTNLLEQLFAAAYQDRSSSGYAAFRGQNIT